MESFYNPYKKLLSVYITFSVTGKMLSKVLTVVKTEARTVKNRGAYMHGQV